MAMEMGLGQEMNYLISYNGTGISSGTSTVDFSEGTITFPDKTTSTLTGSTTHIESITIYSSVSVTVDLHGDITSTVILPASRYLRLRHITEYMKIKSDSTYNLWFAASNEAVGSPEVT